MREILGRPRQTKRGPPCLASDRAVPAASLFSAPRRRATRIPALHGNIRVSPRESICARRGGGRTRTRVRWASAGPVAGAGAFSGGQMAAARPVTPTLPSRRWACLGHPARAPWRPRPAPLARRSVAARAASEFDAKVNACKLVFAASAKDDVLGLPTYMELAPTEVRSVFGYPRDFKDKYILGKKIGSGSFGVVSIVIHRKTGEKYAVKAIPKMPRSRKCTSKYLKKLQNEVDCMKQLGASLSAVFLQDAFEDDQNIYLVMDLCEGGGLLERAKAGRMSEAVVSRIMKQVFQFLAQCHAKGVMYRDVKPDNFLFLTPETDSPLKATDFGLAIRWRRGDPKMTTRSGTPVYMAPEVVLQCYDERADLWSAGMLMYQLLTGRWPFWDDLTQVTISDVFRSILRDDIKLDAEADQISKPAVDLLSKLLDRDPTTRLTAQQALAHPWVSEDGVASDLPLEGSVIQRLQRFATYGHLKQMVLSIIADKITADHNMTLSAELDNFASAVRLMYNKMDVSQSGSISFQELAEGLVREGYNITVEEVRHLMSRMDINQDGQLVFREWLVGLIDWDRIMEDRMWSSYVDLAFQQLDRDGSGCINMEEILDLLPEAFKSRSCDEIMLEAKSLLREADSDGDGVISREEFHSLMSKSYIPDALSQYDARLMGSQSP